MVLLHISSPLPPQKLFRLPQNLNNCLISSAQFKGRRKGKKSVEDDKLRQERSRLLILSGKKKKKEAAVSLRVLEPEPMAMTLSLHLRCYFYFLPPAAFLVHTLRECHRQSGPTAPREPAPTCLRPPLAPGHPTLPAHSCSNASPFPDATMLSPVCVSVGLNCTLVGRPNTGRDCFLQVLAQLAGHPCRHLPCPPLRY